MSSIATSTSSAYNLEKYTLQQLRDMAREMGLRSRRSKTEMINDISDAFQEYETYYKEKIERYTRIRQLGNKGKEGITYLVVDNEASSQEFAMKTFRKTKSSVTLKKEYKLQKRAGKAGIAPNVYTYDTVSKYILMDVMDKHLIDVICEQKGTLYKYQQKRLLEIFRILDEIGVFHGDANIANYMVKDKEIYLIDYGFAKEIDDRLIKSLKTKTPNSELMLLAFVLKLKDMKCEPSAYKYLIPNISEEDRKKFNLEN